MFDFVYYIMIIIISVLVMELIAIITHKYIMHGPGWFLHKSHHSKHGNSFELNDIYFILFSIPSIISIINGILSNNYTLLSIGIRKFLFLCKNIPVLFSLSLWSARNVEATPL